MKLLLDFIHDVCSSHWDDKKEVIICYSMILCFGGLFTNHTAWKAVPFPVLVLFNVSRSQSGIQSFQSSKSHYILERAY